MSTRPNLLSTTALILRVLTGLNFVYGAGIAALFVTSLIAPHWLQVALGFRAEAPPELMIGLRVIMLIGLACVPLAYLWFARLLAMVNTVRGGDPFVPENARRLLTIAQAQLGIELAHLAVDAVSNFFSTPIDPIDLHLGEFSVDGWLAVLLMFVLARVFDAGTRMRADLEGTV